VARDLLRIELAGDDVLRGERNHGGASADRTRRQAHGVIGVRELASGGGGQRRGEPSWVPLDADLSDEVEGVLAARHPGS
jgi:hypothetical protein